LFFLTLVGAISREGTFWLYGGPGVLSPILFAVRVPETKGHSLEQIERELGADAPGLRRRGGGQLSAPR
jgi:hypothetical protein